MQIYIEKAAPSLEVIEVERERLGERIRVEEKACDVLRKRAVLFGFIGLVGFICIAVFTSVIIVAEVVAMAEFFAEADSRADIEEACRQVYGSELVAEK